MESLRAPITNGCLQPVRLEIQTNLAMSTGIFFRNSKPNSKLTESQMIQMLVI